VNNKVILHKIENDSSFPVLLLVMSSGMILLALAQTLLPSILGFHIHIPNNLYKVSVPLQGTMQLKY
jgi:hypothetical protein